MRRYQGRSDELRLPKGKAAQQALADTIGADGATLLGAISSPAAPPWLREVPAVETLRRVWVQNYLPTAAGLRWRTAEEGLPKAAQFVSSPHDADAHLAAKGTVAWVGYKVALTETCEDDAPNLITHVETVPAPDRRRDPHAAGPSRAPAAGAAPAVHLVDSGFLDAELLVASRRDFGVDLLGPTRKDQRWQARAAEGFGVEHFVVDWAQRRVTCPAGHASIQWTPRLDSRGNDSIYVRFSPSDCGPCPSLRRCTQTADKHPRRSLALRPQAAIRGAAPAAGPGGQRRLRARVRPAGGDRGHPLPGRPALRAAAHALRGPAPDAPRARRDRRRAQLRARGRMVGGDPAGSHARVALRAAHGTAVTPLPPVSPR